MAKKLRVGILFGGRSGEHEVSLLSAASILKAIDRRKFDVLPIGITKDGHWVVAEDARELLAGKGSEIVSRLQAGNPDAVSGANLLREGIATFFAPASVEKTAAKADLPATTDNAPEVEGDAPATPVEDLPVAPLAVPPAALLASNVVDVIFPVLHGTFGEDGTVQGLFELAGIAYVGSGVLGSSAGMDKDVMKHLFAQAGLPLVKHVTLLRAELEKSPRKAVARVEATLKYPVFVKPANMGSSVGISKAHDRKELLPALRLAARYDRKLVIEAGVGGKKSRARELEVAVLGNDDPKASVVGEIVPDKEFYDYESKYLSEGSVPQIPARLTRAESKHIREMAVEAFRACNLSGLARVDFLMEPDGKKRIYLNEVNTLPGFTKISMYPKLWEVSGLSYRDLITRLIELAIERHQEKNQTLYSREE